MESLQDLNDMASIERSIPTKQRSSMPVWVSNPSLGVSHRRVGLCQKFSSIDELSEFTKCILIISLHLIDLNHQQACNHFYTVHLNKFTRKVSLMSHISSSWVSRWNIPVLNFGEQSPSTPPPPPCPPPSGALKSIHENTLTLFIESFLRPIRRVLKTKFDSKRFPVHPTIPDHVQMNNWYLCGEQNSGPWWITARTLFSNSSSIF